MAWRGSADLKDRVFSILVYLFPLASAFDFGAYLIEQFPILDFLVIPLMRLALVYSLVPLGLGGLVVFIALYAGVVRNTRINYFLRFNTMQAILIDILLMLVAIVARFLIPGLGEGLLVKTLYNLIFLGTLITCLYSMIQSGLGKYPEIPTISAAAASQVP
jgi:uncharacterized membrane protein